MRFNLVDRIIGGEDGKVLRAVKNLTAGEEYLADHFPTFPVMPGVLMLEALVETGAWFLRLRDDFQHSVIVLREARNVKYGNFLDPGKCMVLTAELQEETPDLATFKGRGEVDGNLTVSARFSVGRYNLRDRNPAWQSLDEKLVEHWRALSMILHMPLTGTAVI